MLLSAFPASPANGQGSYSEKLSVFVSGSNALWYFTFGGINGSSHLSALESAPGLAWYNVTAVKTTGWQSDFQVFGSRGYGLLPFPYTPSQGLFLSVGSDSFADASAAASSAGAFLVTNFVSMSNGTGSYSFYAPVTFGDVVPFTLLKFVPTGVGGFTSAVTRNGLLSTPSPFVILEGKKSGAAFDHSLVAGSITASALDSTGKPTLLGYFGTAVQSLQASSHSSASSMRIRFLDGLVKSADVAIVSSDPSTFSGSYSIALAPGKKITKVNATVIQQPVRLLATRAVDSGVLRTGDNLAVTLTLRNLSPSGSITKVSFSDSWWTKTGVFKSVGGNYTVPRSGIPPLGSTTPVYRLQYNGTTPGSLTIPASVVSYTYSVNGQSFNATATLNPIRLSLGTDDAVVYATVAPTGGYGKTVGAAQSFNVTVVNVGTLPASTVVAAGHSIPGLAAKTGTASGGTATVTVKQAAAGLLGVNVTQSYSVSYQNPKGASLSATTNVATSFFSHVSMKVGYPTETLSAKFTLLPNHNTNLTLTFATSNLGSANVTAFAAHLRLPAGLGCGKVGGKGLTCSSGQATISYPVINASSTLSAVLKYNLTSPRNYPIGPMSFQGMTAGANVTGRSNALGVPAGVATSKLFSPSALFAGMTSQVTASATNSGPFQIFNATVSSTVDVFDSLAGSSPLSKASQSVLPGGNVTFSYGVTALQAPGNFTATAAGVNFFFGGSSYSVQGPITKVQVYRPLTISITTSPSSPIEGKNFTINFVVTNPSGATVSDVLFTLPIPSGLSLSHLQNVQAGSGSLTVSSPTLGPHSTLKASAVAVASSGIVVPFSKAKLGFSYAGSTLSGAVPKTGIAIGEDVTTRYIIPTGFVLLVLIGVAFYLRRRAAPSAPASPA
jgi:hypothetical protein